jgi:hypothetical protein
MGIGGGHGSKCTPGGSPRNGTYYGRSKLQM